MVSVLGTSPAETAAQVSSAGATSTEEILQTGPGNTEDLNVKIPKVQTDQWSSKAENHHLGRPEPSWYFGAEEIPRRPCSSASSSRPSREGIFVGKTVVDPSSGVECFRPVARWSEGAEQEAWMRFKELGQVSGLLTFPRITLQRLAQSGFFVDFPFLLYVDSI